MDDHSSHDDQAADAHPDREDLRADHSKLLDLMKARAEGQGEGVAGVAKAVKSGDWSDPNTWEGGQVPGADMSVVIPEDIRVNVDSDPGVKLMSVVVYGDLEFDTSADIVFQIDELLTGTESSLTIGTTDNPVTGNIDIVIREDTPATTDHGRIAIDPSQMGKGIVTHGVVDIEGSEKTSHLKVSTDPMAGDTEITFDEMPHGWQAGDKIVIAGTHLEGDIPDSASLEAGMSIGVLRAYDSNPDNDPSGNDAAKYTGSKAEAKYNAFMDAFERDDPNFDRSTFDISDPSTHPKGPGEWRFDVDEWKTQDEIRVVTEVTQNADGTWTVSFDEPLEYNHDAPKNIGADAGREPVDFYTSVGNYSRNITISSEVAHSEHPEGAGDIWVDDRDGMGNGEIHDRGHVMFMHNGDVEVRNVEFAGLGRTDKLQMLDDKKWEWGLSYSDNEKDLKFAQWKMFLLDEDGERIAGRDDAVARDPYEIENQPGRYALHFHQTGVDTSSEAAVAQGNAVWGSPGWGIVHHDSHLNILDNAVFGINGGGIVSETGNETGAWNNNLVIKTTGSSGNLFDSGGNEGREFINNDGFHQGVAFGFESRFITSEGNIAASAQKFGYMFTSPVNHDQPESSDDFLAKQGYDPFFGDQDIVMRDSPTREFIDNEAFASETGFGSTLNKSFPNTTVVSTIDGFDSWYNDKGVTLSYVRGYNFKDNIYVGDLTREYEGRNNGPTGWDPATDTDMNRLTNNHFEDLLMATGAPEADVMVNNTYTNVERVWQESGAIADALKDAGGGYAHYIPNDYFEGTVIAETFDDLPRDINHMELIIEESSELKIAHQSDGVYWHGHVEDAIIDESNLVGKGTTFFDFTMAVNTSKKIGSGLKMKHSVDWNDLIERDGYFTDDQGNKFVLVDLVFGSRVTASVSVKKVAIELEDGYPLPPMALHMGSLPHGLSMENRYSDAIIVDLRLPGVSGNQLTDAQMHDAYKFLRPDPGPDGGQYAWQIESNFQDALDKSIAAFDRKAGGIKNDSQREEMKVIDLDLMNKSQNFSGMSAKAEVAITADGSMTLADVVPGVKASVGKLVNLVKMAMLHSGEADVAVVDGGAAGDGYITLMLMTPEMDFLRLEGKAVEVAITSVYAENPDFILNYVTPSHNRNDGHGDHGHGGHGDGGHGGGGHGDGGHGGGGHGGGGHGGGDHGGGDHGGGDHGGSPIDNYDNVSDFVRAAFEQYFGLSDESGLNVMSISDDGIALMMPGGAHMVVSGAHVGTAISGFRAELADSANSTNLNSGDAGLIHFDTDTERKVFLTNANKDIDVGGGETLSSMFGMQFRKSELDDLIFHVLDNDGGDLGDLDVVAGGQEGDNFITVSIENVRDEDAIDFLVLEGEEVATVIQSYYDYL